MKERGKDESVVFGTFPYEADEGKVFVKSKIDVGDGVEDDWFEEKAVGDLRPDDEAIGCVVCGEPAVQVDHLYPDEKFHDRCERHRNSLLDERAYNDLGIGVEVCGEHHSMLNDLSHVERCLKSVEAFLARQDALKKEGRAIGGYNEFRGFSRDLCAVLGLAANQLRSYMKARWPGEQPDAAEGKDAESHCMHREIADMMEKLGYERTRDDERLVEWERGGGGIIAYLPDRDVFDCNCRRMLPSMMRRKLENWLKDRRDAPL